MRLLAEPILMDFGSSILTIQVLRNTQVTSNSGYDASPGMGTQMSAIKLAMAGTQEWWY